MTLFGDLSANQFLADYWQQKPLMVRQAVPGFRSVLTGDELAGLALEPEVESRLVLTRDLEHPEEAAQSQSTSLRWDQRWQLLPGPFTEADFAGLPKENWTLLVQAVDLWVPELKSLLALFDFLPRWRFDDVMVSYAVPGGSVGPHVDQYDVFLLQVEGEREWQLGAASGSTAQADAASTQPASALRVMRKFEPTAQWTLGPGDMLYLPPGVPHWGVAKTDCLTYSIGFRSPSASEMLSDLAVEVLARNTDPQYRDPPLTASMASNRIAPEFLQAAKTLLIEVLDDDALLADWFARFMTAPKYPGLEELTQEQRRAVVGGIDYLNGEAVGKAAD